MQEAYTFAEENRSPDSTPSPFLRALQIHGLQGSAVRPDSEPFSATHLLGHFTADAVVDTDMNQVH